MTRTTTSDGGAEDRPQCTGAPNNGCKIMMVAATVDAAFSIFIRPLDATSLQFPAVVAAESVTRGSRLQAGATGRHSSSIR